MKKLVTLWVIALCVATAAVSAQSFSTVLDRMYTKGLTMYQTEAEFRPNDLIQRGEVAKNLTQFAKLMNLEKSKPASECQFNDIENYDDTLEPHIIEACEYGLVKGFNGAYNPRGNVTEAEMITIIVRALLGFQNENNNPRWLEYYEAAQWLGLLDGEDVRDLDVAATRAKVGTRLYRASLVDTENLEQEGSEELKAILTEIFGEDFREEETTN